MDPNSNSQKPYSGDLTTSTSFHLGVREDEEIPSMVHAKIKKCKIEFQLAKTFNMNSFKSQAQCLKHLLEYIEKLCKETKENCRKSVLKNHRRVRNLKKAKEDKKYPLFIVIQVKKSNGGKSQLLNRFLLISKEEERRLAGKVHLIAFAEIERHPKALEIVPDCEPGQDEDEKIELSKKNLNRILELVENISEYREEFLENFADCSVLRKYAIQKLNEIEQSIQKEKFWCNVGKMAGHAIGGAGAGAQEIVLKFPKIAPVAAIPAFLSGFVSFEQSFILPAAPAPFIPSLVVNGGLAAGIDGFSSFVVAKLTLLRQRMKATKKVLQGRKRDFVDMKNWLKPTKELIEDAFPGVDLESCPLPYPKAVVALPFSVGAAALPAATGCSLSATLLRIQIRKAQEARSGITNLLDEKLEEQVLRQFILQAAIFMLVIAIYSTGFEETRGKKTKIGSSHHPKCCRHCSSF